MSRRHLQLLHRRELKVKFSCSVAKSHSNKAYLHCEQAQHVKARERDPLDAVYAVKPCNQASRVEEPARDTQVGQPRALALMGASFDLL